MVRVRGTCRICGEKGMLDPHHIISQGHAKKTNQGDLISNPGNVVHICRGCHDQTTASMVKKRLDKKDGVKQTKTKAKSATCGRCGRGGHNRTSCHAKTTVDRVAITTKSWKYRPKGKGKKKAATRKKSTKKKKKKEVDIREFMMKDGGGRIPGWVRDQERGGRWP